MWICLMWLFISDLAIKQKDDIVQLMIEKTLLERNIDDLKVQWWPYDKLVKLECSEYT